MRLTMRAAARSRGKVLEMEIGPLQVLVVGLTEPALDGSILDELVSLSDDDVIRLVDILGVYKDEDGTVLSAQVSDLDLDEAMTYGAWVGGLIGLGAAGAEGAEVGALEGAMVAGEDWEYGLSDEDLDDIAEGIPPGGAGLLAIIEHRWAIPLRNAVREQGGIVIAQDFLSPEALVGLGVLGG
jgi:uncharacterized membrane protein